MNWRIWLAYGVLYGVRLILISAVSLAFYAFYLVGILFPLLYVLGGMAGIYGLIFAWFWAKCAISEYEDNYETTKEEDP